MLFHLARWKQIETETGKKNPHLDTLSLDDIEDNKEQDFTVQAQQVTSLTPRSAHTASVAISCMEIFFLLFSCRKQPKQASTKAKQEAQNRQKHLQQVARLFSQHPLKLQGIRKVKSSQKHREPLIPIHYHHDQRRRCLSWSKEFSIIRCEETKTDVRKS